MSSAATGCNAATDDHRRREGDRARHDKAGSQVGRPARTAPPAGCLSRRHRQLYELADLLRRACRATSSGRSWRGVGESGRGTEPSVERPLLTPTAGLVPRAPSPRQGEAPAAASSRIGGTDRRVGRFGLVVGGLPSSTLEPFRGENSCLA